MERKTSAIAESWAFIIVVAAALVLVNIVSVFTFGRWDLTKRQLFTLSDGTKHIVSDLKADLLITVYFTPGQSPPANADERFIRDQLEEYRQLKADRVRVRFVVPDNDTRRKAAEDAGCVKAPLQAVNASEQQATIQEVYRCITFEYLNQRDKIEFLPPGVTGLEYEISSVIKRMELNSDRNASERDRNPTIGFLGGHGEQTPEEGLQFLSQLLEQERVNYRTRTVNLSSGEQDVPDDIKGLIIINPTQQISERELRKIDAYLMRGGSVAVFAGGLQFASTDPTSASGSNADHHLNDWLSGYGLTLRQDVVLDPRSTDGVIRVGRQAGRVRLVTWPVVAAVSSTPSAQDLEQYGGLDPAFPAVFRMPEFIAPYPSTIGLDRTKLGRSGQTFAVFARSGPRSLRKTSEFDLNIVEILQQGETLFNGTGADHGPQVLGVALQGRIHSAFAPEANTEASGDAGVSGNTAVPRQSTRDARLMVVSSGSMLALEPLRTMAQLSGGRPANLTMLFNTFDWLSQDIDLMAIRAKDTSDPQLRGDITSGKRETFRVGAIVGPPVLMLLLGVLASVLRTSRRRALAAALRSTAPSAPR